MIVNQCDTAARGTTKMVGIDAKDRLELEENDTKRERDSTWTALTCTV